MPVPTADLEALYASLGVHLPAGDGRIRATAAALHTTTRDAVNAATADVSSIVTAMPNSAPPAAAPLPGAAVVVSLPRYGAAKKVLEWINGAGPSLAAAAAIIVDTHFTMITFGLKWEAVGQDDVTVIRTNWATLTATQQAGLSDYGKLKHHARALPEIVAISAIAPATAQVNVQTLATICAELRANRAADANRAASVSQQSFPDLRALLALHAPGSAFPGFAAWGPGDRGSVAANITGHFDKHVLGDLGAGAAPAYLGEYARWWTALNIQLTLPEVTARLAAGQNTAAVAAWFSDPSQTLANANVGSFVRSAFIGANPDVPALLRTRHEAAYRDYAIAESRSLTEVFCQSNGIKTFINGNKAGLFVIGRLEAGVLGISSAYFTPDSTKIDDARKNKVWGLT